MHVYFPGSMAIYGQEIAEGLGDTCGGTTVRNVVHRPKNNCLFVLTVNCVNLYSLHGFICFQNLFLVSKIQGARLFSIGRTSYGED